MRTRNHFWSLSLPNISNLQIESQQFLPRTKLLPYYTQATAITLGRQNYGVGSFLKLPSPSLHTHTVLGCPLHCSANGLLPGNSSKTKYTRAQTKRSHNSRAQNKRNWGVSINPPFVEVTMEGSSSPTQRVSGQTVTVEAGLSLQTVLNCRGICPIPCVNTGSRLHTPSGPGLELCP